MLGASHTCVMHMPRANWVAHASLCSSRLDDRHVIKHGRACMMDLGWDCVWPREVPVAGVVCHTYLLATQEQHDVYVNVGLCVCRSVTPNLGVKSEKHFHLELIHSAAKERSPALAPGHFNKIDF